MHSRWLCLLTLAAACTCACAATWDPELSLYGGAAGSHFGQSIAADFNANGTLRALYVGAPNATVDGHTGAGEVYVLSPIGGWHIWTTITEDDGFGVAETNAHFGAAVAAHHGAIVVGAPDEDFDATHADAGSVHVFRDTMSGPEPDIVPYTHFKSTTPTAGNHFGAAVAVDGYGLESGSGGSFIVAGAPDAYGEGCAYAYHTQTGSGSTEGIVCGAAGDKLGASVAVHALSASYFIMVAGSPAVTQNGNALAGQATVYVPNNGNLLQIDTLIAKNPGFLDAFGASVAVDGSRIYVGGTGRQKPGIGRTGSVTLFKPASIIGYDFDVELFPATGAAPGDLCGAAINLNPLRADQFALGCPGSDGLVVDEGFVRVFTLGSLVGSPFWFQDRLDMSDAPHGGDDMGRSVAIAGLYVYAGAPQAGGKGAVRVFVVDEIFKDGFD